MGGEGESSGLQRLGIRRIPFTPLSQGKNHA